MADHARYCSAQDNDQKEKEQFDHSIEAVKKLWDAASAIDPDLKK